MSSTLALAWMLPAFLFLALLQVHGQPAGDTSLSPGHAQPVKKNDKATLIKLKKQADKASKKLTAATEKYEHTKSQHKLAQARLHRTRIQAARADQVYEKYRARVASFSDAAYRSPLPDSNSVLLTATNGEAAVQKATSLDVMRKGEVAAIKRASREKDRADALNRQATIMAKSTAKERSQLAAQVKKLRKKSEESTKALIKLLWRLNGAASRDASRAVLDANCDQKSSADYRSSSFSNGLLPEWALCRLPGYSDEKLRADAARAFVDLNAAYAQQFGRKMCVTDSYRSLAEQQAVYSQKPGLAAVPGKSNHGYGLALDLGCGVQSYGSAQFNWLKQNGPSYGWIHPDWAESSPFEPWHWEYEPEAQAG